MTNTVVRSRRQLVDDLATATTVAIADAERLHGRLVEMAERERLLDVSYRIVDSPLGRLLLAATPNGVVRVAFECEGHDVVLAQLATELSPRILRAPRRLEAATLQLDQYFARRRASFDFPIDLQLAHGFRRTVLTHLRTIDYGRTESYAAIARAIGSPRAVRSVGSACSHNPLPLVVPCHRAVRSDGSFGEYLGGSAAKRMLLAMEARA
jgi:methylated-DNA-[protein]-cysteine S-methyltransferase